MQMWAFIMVHELPYDDPSGCAAACAAATRSSPIARSASARCPTPACSGGSPGCRGSGPVNRFLTWAHWLWFFEPYLALAVILVRHPERFPRAARQMAAVFDIGCAVYFARADGAAVVGVRARPDRREEVRRIMVEVGEDTWGSAWPKMYDALGGNPWAAMPSLHFATSLRRRALALGSRQGRGGARLGLCRRRSASPSSTSASTTSPICSPARCWSARCGAASRWPNPLVRGVNAALQRLERIASG